ncbi:cell division/cell wall cluster transcriptional repressor MraZ [Roseomonas sp. OT10]|uniref:division/cell wall cluster transcriptional repressor MraZ n=1 Tax=Roseomonas cutis TaxID=2897332 RepID=UPI001E437220|nr:cell division/cell wall cluster transcriptional repressor MraZ [Roseomonas sp. OT10]UFN47405.1 cell division/cell wall cluster transcriptional repressor MraZ [Roseomonas sp. OT10]
MTHFLGTHSNKLDKKGRVSIPASFRAALERLGTQDLILNPHHTLPCVEGWPQTSFEAYAATANPASPFEAENDALLMDLFSDAEPLRPDVEGRVVLSAKVIAKAGLTDTVEFVGMGAKFRIWETAALARYKADLAARRAAGPAAGPGA